MQVQLASDDVMQASQGAVLTSTCLEDWTEGGVQCGTSEDESEEVRKWHSMLSPNVCWCPIPDS